MSVPADTDRADGFTYALPGDRTFPEGIAVDAAEDRFYVSSTADGAVFGGDIDGREANEFLPAGADGRTAAFGLEVDCGRLFVAGGIAGSVWVYDLGSRRLLRRFDTGEGGLLNDVAVAPGGDAYVTDSSRPHLYQITPDDPSGAAGGAATLAPFAVYPDFRAGAFNANGIVAGNDSTVLFVNSALGRLYRVDVSARLTTEVDLGGASVPGGDGMLLRGNTLYVVREGGIAVVELGRDARTGRVPREVGDPTFRFPTTVAEAKGRLAGRQRAVRPAGGLAARAAVHRVVRPPTVNARPDQVDEDRERLSRNAKGKTDD